MRSPNNAQSRINRKSQAFNSLLCISDAQHRERRKKNDGKRQKQTTESVLSATQHKDVVIGVVTRHKMKMKMKQKEAVYKKNW